MKTLILFFLLSSSFFSFAQSDSMKIKSLQLTARVIETITPLLMNPNNDSLYQVYEDLRPKFRKQNQPTGSTLVSIDSIPTTELANIYSILLQNPEGLSLGSQFKNQIATTRAANSFLDFLCTNIENAWTDRILLSRAQGRKLLKGK